MELIGKVVKIDNVEQISEKFKKRRILAEYSKNENYPQTLEFTLTQNNVSLADTLNQGDEVKFLFDLKGKPFVDKNSVTRVFNTLEVWRMEVIKVAPDFVQAPSETVTKNSSEDEDLPF